MKRVPARDLIEKQPDDAEGLKLRLESKPPASQAPEQPPGDAQSSSEVALAPKPAAPHPYRAVFVCASRPPERSGPET